MASYVTASLTAENTFCDWITPKEQLSKGVQNPGFLDFMITGTWAGTLTVQKRHTHNGVSTDPIDVTTYTTNKANMIQDHSATVQYRIGFKTGNYTSGTAIIRMEQ